MHNPAYPMAAVAEWRWGGNGNDGVCTPSSVCRIVVYATGTSSLCTTGTPCTTQLLWYAPGGWSASVLVIGQRQYDEWLWLVPSKPKHAENMSHRTSVCVEWEWGSVGVWEEGDGGVRGWRRRDNTEKHQADREAKIWNGFANNGQTEKGLHVVLPCNLKLDPINFLLPYSCKWFSLSML